MNELIIPSDSQNNPPDELRNIIEILTLKPQNRSTFEIRKLMILTQNLTYFKKISKINNTSHFKACKVLSHQYKKKGESVYLPGDRALFFYIVLKGSVTVLLPKSRENLEKEDEEVFSFAELMPPPSPSKKFSKFSNATKTIRVINIFQRSSIKNLNSNDISRVSIAGRKLGTCNSMAQNLIFEKKSPLKSSSHNALNQQKINEYLKLGDLDNVDNFFEKGRFKFIVSKVLKVGMAFWEFGNKNLRNEAIVCNEDCHFAIMSKNDYKEILMEIERIKKNNDLAFFTKTFLKDAPFMSKENLLAFRYTFEKKKYKAGCIIYEAGEIAQDCFLINNGEIELSTNQYVNNQEAFLKNNLMKTMKNTQSIKICTVSTGGLFGEYEILNQIPRVFSAKCLSSKVSLFCISKRKFSNYLHGNHYLQEFLMKKATQTHLWHLSQMEKISHHQDMMKTSNNILQVKATKRLYKYRPIRSSVADIEEVINKDSGFLFQTHNKEKIIKNNEVKIEIKFYQQNFFRGKRILNNECSLKFINDTKIEEKNTKNKTLQYIENEEKKPNFGSKIVEVVRNNEKALNLLKKQKDFASLGMFYRFFETDKTKENMPLKQKRPMSAHIMPKENSLMKNDNKIAMKRPLSSKTLSNSIACSKEFVNYHIQQKSQNLSMNASLTKHKRALSGGFLKKRKSSSNCFQMNDNIPKDLKGILSILPYQKNF